MARTKKADQAKNTGKTAKDAGQEPEAVEQAQEVHQEQEAAEQVQEAAPEQEAAEQVQEAAPEPEEEEQAKEVPVKTSPEEAAAIAAQIEAVGVGKLETGESGETEEAAPEPDMFANLPNPCVYCGPSVKGVARQYTTYQGGIPDALRKFIQEHPKALGLIVSTGKFQAMRRRLETPGTMEAELYKSVKAAF